MGHSNKLINETSPYLLQHAHNPVEWYPWGDEALEKARNEDKPILVSIGYAACHWCHVMEKESFEDEETAALMNKNFVNIKIDREERPDLDHIYMDAVQAMTGSGGWPLNVFLTPDTKPFFGGTYFPPQRAFNRASWREILTAVFIAFKEKRNEINNQAENLMQHLLQSNNFGVQRKGSADIFSKEKIDETFQNLMKTADEEWGGFGTAPKFPQTFSIQFLLRYHYLTGNPKALAQASISLDKMIEGGIYDQLGGGFARYSTDREWLVPHFEKMLYDNALLISVLAEAFQLTKNPRYRDTIDETIQFVEREFMHPDGGFYSALDADSEGKEGKYYVWQYDEIAHLLGPAVDIFAEYFDVTAKGNWEGSNILRVKRPLEVFAREKGLPVEKLADILQKCKRILLDERSKRVRPALDDKIILSWNALMNIACSKAFAAVGKEEYRILAVKNMEFIFREFQTGSDQRFYHTWKNAQGKHFGFLDDYSFLIEALLHLQQITGDSRWLVKAREIAEYVLRNFSEEETAFFFFTDLTQRDVIVRKKEVYDGATPSGNATMAYNLYRLGIYFDQPEWKKRAERMLRSVSNAVVGYPGSFGVWAALLMEIVYGTQEIAVVGTGATELNKQILAEYIPQKVLMASEGGVENLPLVGGKKSTNAALIYLCKNYSCLNPVKDVKQLMDLINQGRKIF